MRWDSLFDDLEAQLEKEQREEDAALRADEERLRLRKLTLRDRIRAASRNGEVLVILLANGVALRVQPSAFGADWLCGDLLEGAARTTAIVPLRAVQSFSIPASAAVPLTLPSARPDHSDRFGLAIVLGDLSRRRAEVRISTALGELAGTIDRVGADHLDLAVHEPDVARRASAVRRVDIVPFSAILSVFC
jgi:hypothetical protein